MEVNKEQAEKCRDLGAAALRRGEYPRAAKMLQKSLRLYPLPGVEALYQHAQNQLLREQNGAPQQQQQQQHASSSTNNNNNSSRTHTTNQNGNTSNHNTTNRATAAPHSSLHRSGSSMGADGREYTAEQVQVVQSVLQAQKGGRGAHYRVLNINTTATEGEIKKAYRKISLKVHPDKNSAPHADEAFKAVGLAYATLSDPQKRTIYDRYGDEDPDNRGGAGAGGVHFRRGGGTEMSPEEIFNAFFGGGGMPGGGPGMHFYSTGFGPGMHFRAGGVPPRGRGQQQQQQRPQQQQQGGLGMLLQLLPIIVILMASFFSSDTTAPYVTRTMPGENQYFSLVSKPPFTNPRQTKLSKVKEIPYFVSDKFLRTYARDRFQLSKVEHMVERSYENYLVNECSAQTEYKKRLFRLAQAEKSQESQERKLKVAQDFELSRCDELSDLFPDRQKANRQRR